MQINSNRFGTLEVSEDKFIHFPLGLLGFETQQRFLLIDSDEAAPMRWLLAVDEPDLAFLVVEPTMFFPDYAFPFASEDYKLLGMVEGEEVVVACLVVIPSNPAEMTINLMGPLVINAERRIGKQVVLHDGNYSTRERLIPDNSMAEEMAMA
jgi:flagellar assembly factor FliW